MCALSTLTIPSESSVFDENQLDFSKIPMMLWYLTQGALRARSMAGKMADFGLSESMLVVVVSSAVSRKMPGF
jgi:hypothetical protein